MHMHVIELYINSKQSDGFNRDFLQWSRLVNRRSMRRSYSSHLAQINVLSHPRDILASVKHTLTNVIIALTKFHLPSVIRYIDVPFCRVLALSPVRWQVNTDRDFLRASFMSSFRFMAALQPSLLIAPVPPRLGLFVN